MKKSTPINWASYWKKNPFWRRMGAKVVNYLQYLNMPKINGCALEVGCGFSRGDKYQNSWVGVDLERIVKPTIIADTFHLPFKSDSFRLVYSFGLIEHLTKPKTALKEMRRVGKIVFFGIPSNNGLICKLHNLFHRLGWKWIFPKEQYYSPDDFPKCRRITQICKAIDFYYVTGGLVN